MSDDEQQTMWNEYKSTWLKGSSRNMSATEFAHIFYSSDCAKEAIELAHTNPFVFRMLLQAAQRVTDHSDSDVNSVWLTVMNDEEIQQLFHTARVSMPPGDRIDFLASIISSFTMMRGRKVARDITANIWWNLPLLDEEREGIIRGLVYGGIREPEFYRHLGVDAYRYALRNGSLDFEFKSSPIFSKTSTNSHLKVIESRFDSLLQHVSLPIDVKDACLLPDELFRLSQVEEFTPGWSGLAKAITHLKHFPDIHEFRDLLKEIGRFAPTRLTNHGITTSKGASSWNFQALRLLHLQQILDAPQISRAVRDPALALVPNIATWLMGQDSIIYQPELRVLRDTDRRWRARWIENAGEAVSVMFLEDTVQLELATLVRIPEQNNELTPDFMAGTCSGEHVVFEAKGSTNWEKHVAQRRQALKQLGKKQSTQTTSWSGTGRTFACSLFASIQGDSKSSLFHVDDPPFQFKHLFSKEWVHHCRREHAIAMLEAARLYGAADALINGNHEHRNSNHMGHFELYGLNSSEIASRYVGTNLPIEDWAHALRHPDADLFKRLRIFVGLDERLYKNFLQNEFPALNELKGRNSPESNSNQERSPGVGFLQNREPGSRPRGLYSLLSDGSFMAVEMDWRE